MTDLLQKYTEVVSVPPEPGTILRTLSGEPAELQVKVNEGQPPFISTRAYISEILDSNLGWYLREPGRQIHSGYRCILMTRARREVVKRCGIDNGVIRIKSLRVVRLSDSGRALLCEVAEYLDDGSSESQ